MSERIDVSRPRLEALLSNWGLGALVEAERASLGIENTNYFVTLEQSDGSRSHWVLTLMARPPTRTALDVLELLQARGLPVPAPQGDLAGEPVVPVPGGGHALLAPRLAGSHPEQPGVRACAAAGRFLARMHAHTAQIHAPEHPRNTDWMRMRLAVHRQRLGFAARDLLETSVLGLTVVQRRRDWHRMPHGVVHGDLFRDNALFEGEELAGVIDFHHAARAPLAFDLAVTANDWCRHPAGGLDRARMLALLRAYDSERSLTPLELWFWPVLLVLAATRFWIARLDSPRKPPEEMMSLLRHLLLHPPRLHPSLAV
ncbi:MAG: homoserine kinase [Pseudomonadales bacterium]|jgi:homoserine kinase type II|nr:homoserine kinase [Pseudomonadales bacterium]